LSAGRPHDRTTIRAVSAVAPLERIAHRLALAGHRLGPRRALYAELAAELERLEPWYQPVDLGGGLVASARDKSGRRHSPRRSFDRGLGKWEAFVRPSLPYPLAGRRVLEVGCNAGMLLVQTLREGAREAVGLEPDPHYYSQARFVARALTRLRGTYVPFRVYRGAMEEVEWPLFGRFDVGFMLQVIYHVGRTRGDRSLSAEETLEQQVKAVRGVASVAEHVVFGANPLEDEGYGKGTASLQAIIDAAGLEVTSAPRWEHPRGQLLIVRGAQPEASYEHAPLARMITKYFLRASDSPEADAAARLRSGESLEGTRYRRLRTGRATWLDADVARLPTGLDIEPEYWVVPWAVRPRADAVVAPLERRFPELEARFGELVRSLAEHGFDESRGRVRVFKLVHPERGELWQYTDGNQRVGAAAHLAGDEPERFAAVPVVVDLEVRRERLLDYPLTRQLVEEGRFTEADVYRWFDHAFDVVDAGAAARLPSRSA
jgi:SAM-dependent methyltransferase